MVAQNELRDGLEHRHLHELPDTRLFACVERCGDGVSGVQAGETIRQRDRRVAGFRRAVRLHQPWNARGALDEVVIGRFCRVRTTLSEPGKTGL